MSNLRVCLAWAPLLALSIVLAQLMNSVTVGYFEHPQMGPTTPLVDANMPQFNDSFLDAKDPALAMIGSMHIAVPPDRAGDNRLSLRIAP